MLIFRKFCLHRSFLLAVVLVATAVAAPTYGGIVPGAVHNWDASTDANGDMFWDDTGSQPQNWSLFGPTRQAVDTATFISHAWSFDGVDDDATVELGNRDGNHDTTIEVWFRPSQLPSGDVTTVVEFGNSPRGISLGLDEDVLVIQYGANPHFLETTFDLDVGDDGIDTTDFMQVVVVVDDTNDQLRTYLNGAGETILASGDPSDFSSKDVSGLAHINGKGGGGLDGSSRVWPTDVYFSGEIAVIREYWEAFDGGQVAENYRALTIPEPATWSLAMCCGAVVGACWLVRRPKKF